MRLLFVNYEFPPVGGGASFASVAMARELRSLGHEIGFLTAANGTANGSADSLDGIHIHRVPAWRRGVHDVGMLGALSFICAAAGQLPNIMRRGRYDACHYYFGLPTGLLSRLPGFHRQKPYVISLRGSDVPGYEPTLALWHKALLPVTRRIWRGAYRVVANSDDLRSLALAAVPAQAIDVIHNGVDVLQRHRPAREPQAGVRILSVGRLIERKGLDTLIEAVAALRSEPVLLDIAGDGPCLAQLQQLARRRGIGDRVTFHGYVRHEQLADLYAQADLFVLPSRAESCSMALLEAMGAGLPIVATRVGGTPELVEHGLNGLLTPADDPAELAAALSQLVRDAPRRAAFAAASTRLAQERFSWRAAALRYEAIFRGAIDPASSRPPA